MICRQTTAGADLRYPLFKIDPDKNGTEALNTNEG